MVGAGRAEERDRVLPAAVNEQFGIDIGRVNEVLGRWQPFFHQGSMNGLGSL